MLVWFDLAARIKKGVYSCELSHSYPGLSLNSKIICHPLKEFNHLNYKEE